MVGDQLEALAVGSRRAIYEMLLTRPRSVTDIASHLPISRPAVSQHLKVLTDAGLARATSVGSRRVYSADPSGMAELREWVDQMWDTAMGGFVDFAKQQKEVAMGQSETDRLEPVIKKVLVPGEPGVVFELFTARTGEWWPLSSHSVGGDDAVDVRIEPRLGGRVYEVTGDGGEHEWGRVTGWEPAARVAFTWYPGMSSSQATHVEITFRHSGEDTELTLVHDGWAARGIDGEEMRQSYDSGWDLVLSRLAGSVVSNPVRAR